MINDLLQDIAVAAAKDAGYNGLVTAQFSPLPDMAVRYQRSSGFIHIMVADYCADMPAVLCRAMIDGVFQALTGSKMVLDPDVRKHFHSADFITAHKATYIRRHIAELADADFPDAPVWVQEIAANYGVTAIAHLGGRVRECCAFGVIHVPMGLSDDPMNRAIIIASCRRAVKKEVST